MLLRCESLEPPMSQLGQTRPFGDLGSMSGFSASGHCWAIYEYTPFCNGPLHLHGSIPRVRRRRRELVRRGWRFMAPERSRSIRVLGTETPRQLALRPFRSAERPHQCCRTLRQLVRCEHTLQFASDQRRPQTNIHSSGGPVAPRTRALACPLNLTAVDDALHDCCSEREPLPSRTISQKRGEPV
jgi:hypothetical protein